MACQTCADLASSSSLADIARAATTRAFSKPVEPTAMEMFDELSRKAGLPTFAEDLAAAQAHLIEGLLRSMESDLEIVRADG
jgi:hypothetical protein